MVIVGSCSGESGGTTTVASGATATTLGGVVTAVDTAPGVALPNPNHARVVATGAYSIDVEGAAGYCNYFVPGDLAGLVYSVSAAELGLSGWDLDVQGNSPESVGVLLNTDGGSFANDAALGNGVINAQADLHHADFDLDLVSMSNVDVVVHISGSIDCP